jgi:cytochrome c oxidase subunit 2
MWFKPLKELETSVVCAQLCGEGHGDMVGVMEVISSNSYASWSTEQSAGALERNTPKDEPEGEPVAAK